jgi:radical SAM protein with 4Fe4S-binding SPASM domain
MQKVSSKKFLSGLAAAGRKRRQPHFITFELSYGCNLTCAHCFNPTHKAGPRELALPEIFRVLEESAAFGVFDVCFTGGEPFARRDFFAILAKAKSLGLSVSINSNGTLIDGDIARRLREIGILKIYLSLYGSTKEVYEAVTGIAGSHARFLAGLDALLAEEIPLTLQMPIMKLNRANAAAARAFAQARELEFLTSVDIYARQDGDPSPLRQRLSAEEKLELLRELGSVASPDPSACARDGASFIDCDCGKVQFAITPYGEMNLCTIFPTPKYDLKNGSVREGWEVLKKTVDEARPNANYECPSCDLRSHCRQSRADAWQEKGDMSACLPHYKDLARLEKEENALAGLSRDIR